MGTSQVGGRIGRLLLAGGLLVGGTAGVLGLAACSSSSTSAGGGSTPSFSPDPQSFSGAPPTALESLAASAKAAVSASAASASAVASAFEASVSAESGRATTAAKAELAKVSGAGNATAEVGLTGLNRDRIGGLNAVVVNITNRSGGTASYAVKINFVDSTGKVVDTAVVGAEDLAAGQKAQPVAFSTKPAELALVPKLAQAQRY
ncbi:hypothetical protein ACEZCY_12585 [Streptacidiphilus sp. N1-12]|uniref:Lipoprotein n=2 Tax=Streptacidiphilus alkalitolerans TaxID=3342712 RepID=A0ABV6V8Z3_9ACTN